MNVQRQVIWVLFILFPLVLSTILNDFCIVKALLKLPMFDLLSITTIQEREICIFVISCTYQGANWKKKQYGCCDITDLRQDSHPILHCRLRIPIGNCRQNVVSFYCVIIYIHISIVLVLCCTGYQQKKGMC